MHDLQLKQEEYYKGQQAMERQVTKKGMDTKWTYTKLLLGLNKRKRKKVRDNRDCVADRNCRSFIAENSTNLYCSRYLAGSEYYTDSCDDDDEW